MSILLLSAFIVLYATIYTRLVFSDFTLSRMNLSHSVSNEILSFSFFPSIMFDSSLIICFAFLLLFAFSISRKATSYILYILRTRISSVFADFPIEVSSFDAFILPSSQHEPGRFTPIVLYATVPLLRTTNLIGDRPSLSLTLLSIYKQIVAIYTPLFYALFYALFIRKNTILCTNFFLSFIFIFRYLPLFSISLHI